MNFLCLSLLHWLHRHPNTSPFKFDIQTGYSIAEDIWILGNYSWDLDKLDVNSTSLSNMVEELEKDSDSPAHVYIETHKEMGSHDPNDDGIFLESDKRTSAERRLVKKPDYRLLPTIVVIFILNFVDVRLCSCTPFSSLD